MTQTFHKMQLNVFSKQFNTGDFPLNSHKQNRKKYEVEVLLAEDVACKTSQDANDNVNGCSDFPKKLLVVILYYWSWLSAVHLEKTM